MNSGRQRNRVIGPSPLIEVVLCEESEQPDRRNEKQRNHEFYGCVRSPDSGQREREAKIRDELDTDRPGRIVPTELAGRNALKHEKVGDEGAE